MQGFTDNSERVTQRLRAAIRRAYNDIGEFVADRARENVVKRTGALADSIRFEVFDDHVTIGSDSEYSSYVELGTGPYYTIPPQWIRNAAERGYHTDDPWWYFDERDGEWYLGWFVTARPYLRPAVMDNVDELQRIFENHLHNA